MKSGSKLSPAVASKQVVAAGGCVEMIPPNVARFPNVCYNVWLIRNGLYSYPVDIQLPAGWAKASAAR